MSTAAPSPAPQLVAPRQAPPGATVAGNPYLGPPQVNADLVGLTDNWRVVLDPDQTAIGGCVVQLLRTVAGFHELSPQEATDLVGVIGQLDQALRGQFGARFVGVSTIVGTASAGVTQHPDFDRGPASELQFHVVPLYADPASFGDDARRIGGQLVRQGRQAVVAHLRAALGVTHAAPVTDTDTRSRR